MVPAIRVFIKHLEFCKSKTAVTIVLTGPRSACHSAPPTNLYNLFVNEHNSPGSPGNNCARVFLLFTIDHRYRIYILAHASKIVNLQLSAQCTGSGMVLKIR